MRSAAEDEVGRARQAQPDPWLIELPRRLYIKEAEWYEGRQGDGLLNGLQLADRQRAIANAVGRRRDQCLQVVQVLEQDDASTDQGSDDPWLAMEGLEGAKGGTTLSRQGRAAVCSQAGWGSA